MTDQQGIARHVNRLGAINAAELYDGCVDRVYRYIRLKVGSDADAEDLTILVFAKAMQRLGNNPQTGESLAISLYRVAHSVVSDHLRCLPAEPNLESNAVERRTKRPPGAAPRRPVAKLIRRALHCLPVDQELVIILKFIDGYTTPQVARMIGISPGAVRRLQYQALTNLRRACELSA